MAPGLLLWQTFLSQRMFHCFVIVHAKAQTPHTSKSVFARSREHFMNTSVSMGNDGLIFVQNINLN